MEKSIMVREWITKFSNGDFDANDRQVQIEAGWYDWFCRETSLAAKTKKMGSIIKLIRNDKILDHMYVFFKNSCPMNGPLYDQFKFCDPVKGNVIYCVNIDCCFDKSKYTVYGIENEYDTPLFQSNSVIELRKYFNDMK